MNNGTAALLIVCAFLLIIAVFWFCWWRVGGPDLPRL
jgi:hypothetical protein